MSDLQALCDDLQALYDKEINARLEWLWDGGIEWSLGDEMNGWSDSGTADSVAGAVRALLRSARARWPAAGWKEKPDADAD